MKLPKVSKKAIVTGAAILAVGGAGLLLYLNTRDSYDGTAWVDSNWLYRRTISVANSGSSLTNEDVLVTIDTATLITNNKLQSNCEDIRFTDSDDGSYLDYWIEDDCNTSNTKIWVRIPSLPSGGKNIYIYYGNSVASAGTLSWDGDIYMYADGSCPSGWTQATGMNDKFLYGSDTFGNTGGSDTHTHDDVSCSSTSISTTPVAAAAPYTIHTFTSSGTFVVNEEITAEVLVVAGGGGGGGRSNGQGAGGGGGGVIYNSSYTFAAGSYSVTVGAGGAAGVNANRGGNGGNSSVGTLTAIGGGGGGSSGAAATGGGSGGGGSKTYPTPGSGTSGQGNSGGAGYKDCNMGGGGGAGSAGTSGSTDTSQCWLSTPGSGGNAYASSITGVTKYYGGGGGAASVGYSYTKKRGVGKGGGGYGGYNSVLGSTGTPNTGGGGGGGGGAGGSGIVIIRYASGGKATGGTATPASASSPSTTHTHAIMSNVVDSASNVPSNRSMLLCSRKKFTFPTGSIAQFATMPSTGWTRYSNLDDVFPRVANTSGVTGGSNTHTHNLTAANTSGALGDIVGMGHFSGSGGTVTTSGLNKIHTFTSSGTFTATGNGVAEVLVVAGGGGGGNTGSGGGAGGFLNDLLFGINTGTYAVTVGAGGAGGASPGAGGANGGNSVFSSLTAIGGGGGRTHGGTTGASGGSGSGAPLRSTGPDAVGGAGTEGQGNAGGPGGVQTNNWIAANAGGGGAGSVGGGCPIATEVAGTGGQGLPSWVTGSEKYYAGGGFGGEVNQGGADSTGGIGGGGIAVRDGAGGDGTANTGGGGGGGSYAGGTYMNGGAGGSGIVVISYIASDPVSVSGQNHVHTTNSSSSNSSSNLPPYKKLLFGLANSDSYVTSEYILITSENPPLGYNRYTDLDNRFAIGSSVFGETGGSSSHSHTMNISTGASSSSMILALGTGITLADASHTHSCTATSPSASSLPSYYSVIYTQRKESKEVIISKETTESSPPPNGSDSWVDSDWLYKRPINIENSGSGVVYEDVLITVDTASLISSGKLQSNCEDLRFEDSDYSGFLSYWIEDDCNTSNTKIWVRIPNLPSGGKNIYMYYGNSSASAGTLPWGGTIYMYSDSSCPEGWTQATAMNDKFLYGSYTFGNTGGSGTHTHGSASCTSNTSTGTTGVYSSSGDVLGSGAEHTHTLNTGFSSSSNVPPYKGMVLCYRKKFTFSTGLISIFAGNSPTGYTRFTGLDDYFPRVMSSYGGTGGSSTHTHTGVAADSSAGSTTQGTAVVASQEGTGGTITTLGNDRVHTFTSSGTFTALTSLTAQALVVGGGGGGGDKGGGGGGAGGLVYSSSLNVPANSYNVIVGSGGAAATNGGNSSFSSISATGGGGGGRGEQPLYQYGKDGGSGGGGSSAIYATAPGGNPVSGQGNAGGRSINDGISRSYAGGGGGGCGQAGTDGQVHTVGNGGIGCLNGITGTNEYYAGGGGGGWTTGKTITGGTGGLGGGGNGASNGGTGQNGTANTGGGGGGNNGLGGSGIVIIRYTYILSVTAPSSTHTHSSIADSVSSASNIPPYKETIFGKVDSDIYVSSDNILITSENPPLGYDRFSELDAKFTKGATTYGGAGGSSTHVHNVSMSTTSVSGEVGVSSGSATSVSDISHTHSCSTTSPSASNLPAYYSVIYTKRKDSKATTMGDEMIESNAPDTPSSLLTDSLTNPTGVITPKFSAIFTDSNSNDKSTHYQIEVNTNTPFTGTVMWDSGKVAFATPVDNGSRTPDITYAGTTLQFGVTYYWRIKLWDNAETSLESPWSEAAQFTTNYRPNQPSTPLTNGLVSPTKVGLVPTFSAVYVDSDNDDEGVSYQIIMSTNSNLSEPLTWDSGKTTFSTPVTNNTRSPEIAYSGDPLSEGTTYYWQMRIWDSKDTESEYSATSQFKTLNSPSSPTGLWTNGSSTPGILPSRVLTFSAIYSDGDGDSAGWYRIQVSSSSSFDTVLFDSGKKSTSILNGERSPDYYFDGSSLLTDSGNTYYWRIKFFDVDDTEGSWSEAASFRDLLVPSSFLFEGVKIEGIKID